MDTAVSRVGGASLPRCPCGILRDHSGYGTAWDVLPIRKSTSSCRTRRFLGVLQPNQWVGRSMSGDHSDWVLNHSPLRGTARLIHVLLAGFCDEATGNLSCRRSHLA